MNHIFILDIYIILEPRHWSGLFLHANYNIVIGDTNLMQSRALIILEEQVHGSFFPLLALCLNLVHCDSSAGSRGIVDNPFAVLNVWCM